MRDEDLARMSRQERRALAARLAALDAIHPLQQISQRRLYLSRAIMTGACLVMGGWIVLLLITLPNRYTADHWRLAWVGFDIGLLAALAALAWAAWRLRHIAVIIMIVTATLLICDAWFDVTLSRNGSDRWASLATALAAELPLATLLLLRARHLMMLTAAVVASRTGSPPPRALHRIPLLTDDTTPSPNRRGPTPPPRS
jgi:hypothetical protein